MIIVKFSLVFSRHSLDDLEVGDVERLVTVLMVLAYATVRPVPFLNSALMFSPSSLAATAGLPNIDFTTFGAHIFVYALFFSRVNFAFVFTAEYIFELGAGGETGVYACFG